MVDFGVALEQALVLVVGQLRGGVVLGRHQADVDLPDGLPGLLQQALLALLLLLIEQRQL